SRIGPTALPFKLIRNTGSEPAGRRDGRRVRRMRRAGRVIAGTSRRRASPGRISMAAGARQRTAPRRKSGIGGCVRRRRRNARRGGGVVMNIPMCEPDITAAERVAVDEVLRGTTLSIGPRLELFERRVAAYVGARHAAGVSSGTAGLHLCMLAAGVGESDLGLPTRFSFVASANAAMYVRARPIFVDVEPRALTIDPQRLADTARTLSRPPGRR